MGCMLLYMEKVSIFCHVKQFGNLTVQHCEVFPIVCSVLCTPCVYPGAV